MTDEERRGAGTAYFAQPGGRLSAITFLSLGALYVANLFGFGHQHGWFRVIGGGCAVLVLVSVVPQWRAGIYTDATELQGRKPLPRRKRTVSWADVDHFELRGYWRGLGARTVSGQWVPLMVYGGFSGQAIQIANELETYRVQRHHAPVDRQSRNIPKVRPHN